MRKKPTRKRPYFKMESAMTAILRDASGKMHHGILFGPPLTWDEKYMSNLEVGFFSVCNVPPYKFLCNNRYRYSTLFEL